MDDWDGRLKGIQRKTDEKVDDSIADMMARQAKQARAVQAKALQKIVDDGFRTSKGAADAYFRAAQEERVIRGEPSDRLNVVQDQMVQSRENYAMLKRLLSDAEGREVLQRLEAVNERIKRQEDSE
jgi:hypothetical protein